MHRWIVLAAVTFLATPVLADPQSGVGETLLLTLHATDATVEAGEPLKLEARFTNRSAAPLSFFVPLHAGLVPFPSWVLEHEDGTRYEPATPSFQSMWKEGLQGQIVRLAPGASKAFAIKVQAVIPAGAKIGSDTTSLRPGRYRVTATYKRKNTRLPYSTRAFEVEMRAHKGLWTGTARTAAIDATVGPSRRPVLTLDAPERAAVGQPYVLRYTLRNQREEPWQAHGAFVLRVGSKPNGTGTFRFVRHVNADVPSAGAHRVTVPALGSITGAFDLSALSFTRTRQGRTETMGLFDLLGSAGLFRIGLHFEEVKKGTAFSAGVSRHLARMEPTTDSTLRLLVEPVVTKSREPVVDVVLRNEGPEPVRVPAHMSMPGHLYFSLIHERSAKRPGFRISRKASGSLDAMFGRNTPGRHGVFAAGMSWNGDRFERMPAYENASFVLLAAGGELRRRVRLREWTTPNEPMQWGPYQMTAYYRNRENGRRLGVDEVFTGLIRSSPVVVRGRGW